MPVVFSDHLPRVLIWIDHQPQHQIFLHRIHSRSAQSADSDPADSVLIHQLHISRESFHQPERSGINADVIPVCDLSGDPAPFLEIVQRSDIAFAVKTLSLVVIDRSKIADPVVRHFFHIPGRDFRLFLPVCQGRNPDSGKLFCNGGAKFRQVIMKRARRGAVFLFQSDAIFAEAERTRHVVGADRQIPLSAHAATALNDTSREFLAQFSVGETELKTIGAFAVPVQAEIFRIAFKIIFRAVPLVIVDIPLIRDIQEKAVSPVQARAVVFDQSFEFGLSRVAVIGIPAVPVDVKRRIRIVQIQHIRMPEQRKGDFSVKFPPAGREIPGPWDSLSTRKRIETAVSQFLFQKVIDTVCRSVVSSADNCQRIPFLHGNGFQIGQFFRFFLSEDFAHFRGVPDENAFGSGGCLLRTRFHPGELHARGFPHEFCEFSCRKAVIETVFPDHDDIVRLSVFDQFQCRQWKQCGQEHGACRCHFPDFFH